MDDERQRKLETGREKLAAYKKKKQRKLQQSSESTSASQSDASLSLSPPSLPENALCDVEPLSDSSIISEHLNSNSDSVENDRSYQEIEISNVPSNFSLIFQNLPSDEDVDYISQENKPPSLNTSVHSTNTSSSSTVAQSSSMNRDAQNNVQSILDEILASEQFRSDSDNTLQKNSSADSNESSFNLFDGVDLNDSLINNYTPRSKPNEDLGANRSRSVSLHSDNFNVVLSSADRTDGIVKVKQMEELLSAKDTTIAALAAELESLRELTSSNHSTMSLNTSTTDYKLYHDEFQTKIVEYQNAISHRDSIIQQLTEALQQSVVNREQLQDRCEHYSKDIAELRKLLAETSETLRQHKCDVLDTTDAKQDSIKSIKDSSNQTDSLPSQILRADVENLDQNIVKESIEPVNQNQAQLLEKTVKVPVLAQEVAHKEKPVLDFEIQCSILEETLNLSQTSLMNELKNCINSYIQHKSLEYENAHRNELKILEDKLKTEKMDHELEMSKLKELLSSLKCESTDIVMLRQELEAKHAKELEELRTYFEQKCADLEKHYSEEVFNQQSRKMSGSSSCSETSDFIFSSSRPLPGPGGDSIHVSVDVSQVDPTKRDFSGLNKEDLVKLKADLSNITKALDKYNFENSSKQDLAALKAELNKYDLRILLKYDLSAVKAEMQNKYHAELEILREDYENRIDALNVEHDSRMQSMERKYADRIESLKFDLDEALRNVDSHVSTAVQEVMLVENTAEDAVWPTELLQLRNRFTERYEKQIAEMEEQHQEEIEKLKEDHRKILNGALERARKRSLKDDNLSQSDLDIIKERDNLKKTTAILRQLIGELMKYFTECEEELNNTLVDELLKHGFDKNLTELEVEINLNESSNSTCSDSLTNKKRVHFTPRFEELMATIDSSVPSSLDSNISVELKNELGECLKRLRADANAILALSVNINKNEDKKLEAATDNPEIPSLATDATLQDKISSLTRQLVVESQMKKLLTTQLNEAKDYIHNLETERITLDEHIEQLVMKQKNIETDLSKAREKIAELIENGHKEIVSEGYGENPKLGSNHTLGEKMATLAELQERARSMVAECASTEHHPLLQLVEELCREGDRITEEAKNDREDLQQQEEDLESHNACCRNFKNTVAHTVEHLEQQMREMSKLIEANEVRYGEVEAEKKEAIEKVFVLRDIIRDLEAQVETKAESEEELRKVVAQLEEIIQQQNKTNEELTQHLSSVRNIKEAQQFQEHIEQLEDEVQRLRLNTEFAGSEGVLKKIKTQLDEFEANLDKRTRELEALHSTISTTSCSSPSEDMSIKDQIRPRSPSALEECDVPLQQLARLKEKLIKHSRAEDAAVKRIRDLEMELVGIRHDLDEVQNERDLLQDQVSEQLVLISSLQMRLDDQRLRAEQFQKQTNTSLEMRIYSLENEVKSLTETINVRDKTIKQQNKTIEETRKKLSDQEKELASKLEDPLITELQREVQKMRAENASLLTKINSDAQNAQMLPNLVDNILADKNKDIEKLREKLDKTQSELNTYLSLNLDFEQLKTLSRLNNSERAFTDILSLVNLDAPDKMRMAEKLNESLSDSVGTPAYKRNVNETTYIGLNAKYEPEVSSIELVGQPNINYTIEAPLSKPNSTEIHHRSNEKRVHFDESIYNTTIEKLQAEILELKNELFARDETIKEYTERLKILTDLEVNIEKLQEKLDSTENALQKATETFEKEQNTLKEVEKELRVELAEKKMHLIDKEKQLELSEQDSARKDQMYINLAKEKRELEKCLKELQENNDRYKNLNDIIQEKDQEIQNLKDQMVKLEHSREEIKEKLIVSNNEIKEKDELNLKLSKDLKNKEVQLNCLTAEAETLRQVIEDKNNEIEALRKDMLEQERESLSEAEAKLKEMKNILVDRETEIEILNEDVNRYQDDIAKLENKLRSVKNEMELKLAQSMKDVSAKELQIVKIMTDLDDATREISHLQEVVEMKDKVINQMNEDSKSLHINLETIQNKMQESGNIVDLKRRLEEEMRHNSELQKELATLKAAIMNNDYSKPVDMTASIEEITGAVRQQLDYSARLDSSILSALAGNDQDQTDFSTNPNDIQTLKQALSKEKSLNSELNNIKETLQQSLRELKQKYENEKANVAKLKTLLENEKQNCNAIQIEDANMLEQLRLRLERALENETEFEKLLDTEKRTRRELELQVINLKQKAANLSSGENSKTELTEYKSLPNMEPLELTRMRKELQSLQEENTKLKTDIKNLKKSKGETEANLKFAKDMLELKNEEVAKLDKQMEEIREAEASVREKWISCKAELEQRNQEVENSRILIGEIEQERKDMKKEIQLLNENLKKALERENKLIESSKEGQLKQPVPDKFLNKMKELSDLVKEHIKDNQQMSQAVDKLTDERRALQERIAELEELNNIKLPFDDPVARANHLFAKYLRSESYRKALIWQKKYLVALLATYQTYPLFSKELPLPFQSEAIANKMVRSNGVQRFKAVALSITAIIRMQYLVKRWHSGKRGAQLHNMRPSRFARMPAQPPVHSTAHFQVGQPVSSQNFPVFTSTNNTNAFHTMDLGNGPLTNFTQQRDQGEGSEAKSPMRPSTPPDLGPWSGATPPSKDPATRSRSSAGSSGHHRRKTPLGDDFHPLQAPALLSQYVERFDQIQQRLGIALEKNST